MCLNVKTAAEHCAISCDDACNCGRLLAFQRLGLPRCLGGCDAAQNSGKDRCVGEETKECARRDDAVEFVAITCGQGARGCLRRGDGAWRGGLLRPRARASGAPAPTAPAGVRAPERSASRPAACRRRDPAADAASVGGRRASARSRSSADAAERKQEADERVRA